MGKTIRRKGDTSLDGWYTSKVVSRNHPKAGVAYVHADMPNRDGRNRYPNKAAKHEQREIRRVESRAIKHAALTSDDEGTCPPLTSE